MKMDVELTGCSSMTGLSNLIVWGYIKLIFDGLGFVVDVPTMVSNTHHILHDTFNIDGTVLMVYVLFVFLILDVISNIILLIGSYMKSHRVLKSYSSYAKFLLGLFIVLYILNFTDDVYFYNYNIRAHYFWFMLAVKFTVAVYYTVSQRHILHLVKCEINRLEDVLEVKLKNEAKAAEAEFKYILEVDNGMHN